MGGPGILLVNIWTVGMLVAAGLVGWVGRPDAILERTTRNEIEAENEH
jgi:hypothetical protein